jgi:hypothetical protein
MYTKITDFKATPKSQTSRQICSDKIPVNNNILVQFNIIFYPLRG